MGNESFWIEVIQKWNDSLPVKSDKSTGRWFHQWMPSRSNSRLRVAIQGVRASFHDVAARQVFPGKKLALVECASFPILCQALERGQADVALMAIENSIAGSILPNYVLLEKHRFWIESELYLKIELFLLALPGQKLKDLRYAQSHPMAILQCADFLGRHPHLVPVEASDTAESARELRELGRVGTAAIASRLAAKEYGLKIFASRIESGEQSFTRFLVLKRRPRSRDPKPAKGANKVTLRFEVSSRRGSLARVLQALADAGWSGTKIQSVPIPRRPGSFSIHLDAVREKAGQGHAELLRVLKPEVQKLVLLGAYRSSPLRGRK